MSAGRWPTLKSVLRPHMETPLRGVPPHIQYKHVMGLLRTLSTFQVNTPYERTDALDAHLEISILADATATRECPTFRRRVLTKLWPAVLPWEGARGLSGTDVTKLIPKALLTAPQEVLSSKDSMAQMMSEIADGVADSTEVGMMFVTPVDVLRSPEPASFWSGAISGPIDVAFFQRIDTYSELRGRLAPAALPSKVRGVLPESPHFDPHSLRGHGVELALADQGKLEPFSRHDSIAGTPLVRLYPDLYARRRTQLSSDSAAPEDSGRCTEVMSRVGHIAVILELRRRYFFDHISSALLSSPTPADGPSGDADVHVSLQLSDALHEEILEKQTLQRTMIVELESAIRDLLRLSRTVSTVSHNHEEGPRGAEEVAPEERHQSRQPDGWASRSTLRGAHDRHEIMPSTQVDMHFEGRFESSGGDSASHKMYTSASARLKYPDSDPRMAKQPKLPYELITLAYRLSLCVPEITSLGARIIRELSDEAYSGVDKKDVLHLTSLLDTSLIVPEEVRGAIRASASRLGVPL